MKPGDCYWDLAFILTEGVNIYMRSETFERNVLLIIAGLVIDFTVVGCLIMFAFSDYDSHRTMIAMTFYSQVKFFIQDHICTMSR